jgi:hypothetical protein
VFGALFFNRYAGVPPPGFIADSQTEEAEKILEKCLESKKAKDDKSYKKEIKLCDGYPQILIKIIDSLMLEMESNLLGTLVPIYLPRGKEGKYKYEKNVLLKDAKNDVLSKKIKKGSKAADHAKQLNEMFAKETKIDHYDLDSIAAIKEEKEDKKEVKKKDSKKKGKDEKDKVKKVKSKKK